MTIQEVLKLDLGKKHILILGEPASGKTHVSKIIDANDWYTVHTDNYIGFGIERGLEAIIEDSALTHNKPFSLVEGCGGYDLLLEGHKSGRYIPDIIIDVQISKAKQREIYMRERNKSKIKRMEWVRQKHMQIMNEWHRLTENTERPIIYQLNNEF